MTPSGTFKDVQTAFAAHLRDPENNPAPEDIEDRRMAIYRDLFFNNVRGFISNNFPVLRKLYDDDSWDALVRDFFAHHQSHTPLFPELPREFLRFVEERRGPEQGDPPFLLELAHYEWAELALSLDAAEINEVAAIPDGDLLAGVPVKSPVAWLLSYQFPVQHIRPDFQPSEPSAQPTHLVVYRTREDDVRFMELNAVSARLLQLVDADTGATGLQCIEQVATELGTTVDAITGAGRQVLEQLRSRDILLGTQPV
ncbi:MAG: putative DNA-binding domain-containing protein [Pseudomonadota bacterium]